MEMAADRDAGSGVSGPAREMKREVTSRLPAGQPQCGACAEVIVADGQALLQALDDAIEPVRLRQAAAA